MPPRRAGFVALVAERATGLADPALLRETRLAPSGSAGACSEGGGFGVLESHELRFRGLLIATKLETSSG